MWGGPARPSYKAYAPLTEPSGVGSNRSLTPVNSQHQLSRQLLQQITQLHKLHKVSPPVSSKRRISDQVRICNWQDPVQQAAAASELQAFCAASIQNLGLQSFKPLLLKGAVSGWRAVDLWSLDYLVEQYGEQR